MRPVEYSLRVTLIVSFDSLIASGISLFLKFNSLF